MSAAASREWRSSGRAEAVKQMPSAVATNRKSLIAAEFSSPFLVVVSRAARLLPFTQRS